MIREFDLTEYIVAAPSCRKWLEGKTYWRKISYSPWVNQYQLHYFTKTGAKRILKLTDMSLWTLGDSFPFMIKIRQLQK